MLRAYQYLFYRLYLHQSRWKDWDPTPQITALYILTAILFMHALALAALIEALLARSLFPPLSAWHVIVIMTAVFALQYYLLVSGRRYTRIIGRFHDEPADRARSRGFIIVGYLVTSWIFLICVALLRARVLHTKI